MNTTYTINNRQLSISVNCFGAELTSIKSAMDGKEFMWDANPAVWAGSAPVLFPVIGALKDDTYIFNGKPYKMLRHGFIRNNPDMVLSNNTKDCLTFRLKSSAETQKNYPFDFEFYVSYRLDENRLHIEHKVVNTGKGAMFFSLGAHPAFKCPVEKDENYSDYFLEFEHPETEYTYQIESSGLIGPKTDLILNNSKTIQLHHNLFDKGALVFKTIQSKKVSLNSRKTGKRIEVQFDGFPYLGIWAKPNADYVCIEPWMGIADSIDTNQQLESKEGILKLDAEKSFEAKYSIKVEGVNS